MMITTRRIVTKCYNREVVVNRLGSAYDLFHSSPRTVHAERPHILIVDDDKQIRTSLSRFLTASGFRVSAAEDGVAMFAAVAKGRFDLIVLDIMMPGEDGLTVCRRLREASRAPVIFLTALSGEIDCVVGLELGADDYISKPIRPGSCLRASVRCCVAEGTRPRSGKARQSLPTNLTGWRLDAVRRTLRNPEGALVELTGGEFDLLLVFVGVPGRVLNAG